MSLIKKPHMTEKKLAAVRRMQKLSHGPVTPEGRARIRDANLRHGFYSQSDEVALRALGEDPEEFRELLEGLRDQSSAAAALQKRLGEHLARSFWRMRRADRMHEGYALRQSKEEDSTREGRLHMQMMRLKMISRNWQLLAQSVACEHYITTRPDLEMMKHLHKDGAAKEMSEVALALFYQLREPGLPGPGDPAFEDMEEEAKARRVVAQVRAIFGVSPEPPADGAPASRQPQEGQQDAGGTQAEEIDPHSKITEEQWEAREPARQLLENILTRQVEIIEAQHHDMMRQCLAGPSPQERAAEIVPTHPNSKLMQRMEDSNFRQVARMTSLLIRMKRVERQRENPKKPAA